ncbi:helix-turn-helix transcriptional regulator [Asaia siamensis]|uniref:AraC family transcriptional regulator n=1 Tax=Asaia siamensis TaxID=110479 RepID=A0ABQ1LYD8_9PROT|nr:helix-turn-helix transcriptional regulator [Asaia siamensis]GGC30609.1 AraC family transcriptional regulator [Asaia siamensis]
MCANLFITPPDAARDDSRFWLHGGSLTQDTRRIAPRHHHARGQILGLASGVMVFRTNRACWSVGPGQVLWLPPDLPHEARSHGAMAGWTLYLHPCRCTNLPDTPFLAEGTPLLNAQAERLAQTTQEGTTSLVTTRLAESFWDEWIALPRRLSGLPIPSDPRLRRVTDHLEMAPGDRRSQSEWAALAGMSLRSFVRHFRADTGAGFAVWLQKRRMIDAQQRLARGERVTDVALAVGYESIGAFSASFRRSTGCRPSRFAVAQAVPPDDKRTSG